MTTFLDNSAQSFNLVSISVRFDSLTDIFYPIII